MRVSLSLLILALLSYGCASFSTRQPESSYAALVGLPEEEYAALAYAVAEKYKLVVLWAIKEQDGVIRFYMSNAPKGFFGICVAYRKVDGRWQEVPNSVDNWIS